MYDLSGSDKSVERVDRQDKHLVISMQITFDFPIVVSQAAHRRN